MNQNPDEEKQVFKSIDEVAVAFPPNQVETHLELIEPFSAFSDVRIINTGRCGNFGSFQAVQNNNRGRSINATVRSWDNRGNFDNTRVYRVPPGGRTPLPGCTDLGGGQTMQNEIVGAEYVS